MAQKEKWFQISWDVFFIHWRWTWLLSEWCKDECDCACSLCLLLYPYSVSTIGKTIFGLNTWNDILKKRCSGLSRIHFPGLVCHCGKRWVDQIAMVDEVGPHTNVLQVETLHQACEWQLWDAERFRKLVKNDEDAHIWVCKDAAGWWSWQRKIT